MGGWLVGVFLVAVRNLLVGCVQGFFFGWVVCSFFLFDAIFLFSGRVFEFLIGLFFFNGWVYNHDLKVTSLRKS